MNSGRTKKKQLNAATRRRNPMAVLTKTHPNEDAARRVVGAPWAAAEPRGDILLPTGPPLRDTRRQAVGGFAGPVRPDAPVGTYSGHIRRRQGAGSFATGSFAGDTDRERKGSFGDIERALIVTHKAQTERSRVRRQGGARGARASGRGQGEGERDARARLARDAL
jgi:hypothetical protein